MSRNRVLLLAAAALALLLVVVFALSLTRSGPGEDRLSDTAPGAGSKTASPQSRCGSQRTYELVKRELFRQAGQTRGSDQAAFDRLSAYATIRVEEPVLKRQDESLGTMVCSGRVALDLPPGVAVVGGRRTLAADMDYAIQPAADGSGDVVTLSGADGIVVPLATLARTGTQPTLPQAQPAQPPAASAPTAPLPPPEAVPPVDRVPDRVPSPPATELPQAGVGPSFDCTRARTRGERSVCASPQLSALDRQMAGFFGTAYRGADPGARELLQRTRTRFLAYRDSCGSDACIADAYRGRIREIRDIVDGRWRSQ